MLPKGRGSPSSLLTWVASDAGGVAGDGGAAAGHAAEITVEGIARPAAHTPVAVAADAVGVTAGSLAGGPLGGRLALQAGSRGWAAGVRRRQVRGGRAERAPPRAPGANGTVGLSAAVRRAHSYSQIRYTGPPLICCR